MTISIQEVEKARKIAIREVKDTTILQKINTLWLKSYKTEWFSNAEAAFIDAITNGVYSNVAGANGRNAG